MWRAGNTCELELELELGLGRENEFRLLTGRRAARREKEGDVKNGTRVDCRGAVGCWGQALSGGAGGRGRMEERRFGDQVTAALRTTRRRMPGAKRAR